MSLFSNLKPPIQNLENGTIGSTVWSLITRGPVGRLRKASRKYLPLYVAEFHARCSNCGNAGIFREAMRSC